MTYSTTIAEARPLGRPREFDMDRVLDAAVTVFRQRGYNATSITDLRRATGLTAGSLYKAFKDKRGVFVAALERYTAVREDALARRLADATTGREQIRAILLGYANVACGAQGRLGCMVLGGVTDMDTFDAALADRFRGALDRVEKRFAGCIEEGVRDGSLPGHLDVHATARYLSCVVEGMRVLGKRGMRKKAVDAVIEQTMRGLA